MSGYGGNDHCGAVPATVVGSPECTFTRPELQELLKESAYGANHGAYIAYFTTGHDGSHVCRTCGRPLGVHEAAAQTTPAAAVSNNTNNTSGIDISTLPPPDVNINEPQNLPGHYAIAGMGQAVSRPRHWQGGMWYANYLVFDGYAGTHQEMTGSRKHRRLVTRAHMRWRCVAPNADHSGPCGATFITQGVTLQNTLRPAKGEVASMAVVAAAGNTIEKHYTDVHQLETASPGQWSTGLMDYCAHPMAALSCGFYYMSSPMPCCMDGRGISFCAGLTSSAPSDPNSDTPSQALVGASSPDVAQCSPGCVAGLVCSVPFLPHFIIIYTFAFLGSIITLCGFPCDSDGLPPLMCCCCYQRRRNFVEALKIAETPMESRIATVCCCPCSELQQWRELRDSGVWVGLVCCTASEEDKAAMEPSAVRARYSVDGVYGVRARPGAHPLAQRTAALIDEFPGPNVGFSMA